MRSALLNHLIHHRGQLTVYLRQNDVPLPFIYGTTADESLLGGGFPQRASRRSSSEAARLATTTLPSCSVIASRRSS